MLRLSSPVVPPARLHQTVRRGARLLTAAALLVGASASATRASDVPTAIQVSVERDGDRFVVAARAELQADARIAWDTLTDYEKLPEFVPGVSRSRVLKREPRAGGGERLVVEYLGRLKLWFFSLPTQVWLDVQHQPFTEVLAQSAAVIPGAVRPAPGQDDAYAPSLKSFRGRYDLAVVGGKAGLPRLGLSYSAQFELAEPMPPVLGALFGEAAVRQAVREQFAAMVAEIERRSRQRPRIEAGKGG